jgi:segregation and condensation protein B
MTAARSKVDAAKIKAVAESLLFVSDRPVKVSEVLKVLTDSQSVSRHAVIAALEELKIDYIQSQRSFRLAEIAGGYQLRTRPEFAPYIARFLSGQERTRLSRAAVESLAIIAYRQPVARAEIESIRGVDVGGILKMLQERNLIKIAGRKNTPGRPFLYGTTTFFLEHFGLNSLADLPRAGELTLGRPRRKEAPSEGQGKNEGKRTPAATPSPSEADRGP